MDNREKLLTAMKNAGKPLKAGEAADLADLSKADGEKALKQLKDEGLIESPKRCYWQPK